MMCPYPKTGISTIINKSQLALLSSRDIIKQANKIGNTWADFRFGGPKTGSILSGDKQMHSKFVGQ